ncbi:lactonase, 7-bladed beta-propeller domain-containing protein [Sarocladium implicatum]|nr:lactonase, 7-bladed beta-propeller domain-containing protein [Sarocladium implicatum]
MLPLHLLGAALLPLAPLASALPASSHNHDQSYTLTVAHQNRGLLSISFDPSSCGSPLRIIETTPGGFRPQWLCRSGKNIYSLARTQYPEAGDKEAGIYGFSTNGKPGHLEPVGDVSTDGDGATHCGISPDGRLLGVANIDVSSASLRPRHSNGTLGAASHVFNFTLDSPGPGYGVSQLAAHPHQIIWTPSGNFLFIPDRGADVIHVFHTPSSGQVTRLEDIEFTKGSGPRHAEFWRTSETQSMMVVIGELDNSLRVFAVDEKETSVDVKLLQTVSSRGGDLEPTKPEGKVLGAEVVISPDGRFVYASNRNKTHVSDDWLGVYRLDVNALDEPLSWVGKSSTWGRIPRHFAIGGGSEGKYVAVLNQVSNDLQIFERDIEGGLLGDSIARLVLGEVSTDLADGPTNVIWD